MYHSHSLQTTSTTSCGETSSVTREKYKESKENHRDTPAGREKGKKENDPKIKRVSFITY